ncbi:MULTISPECIES: hypothetical protein [Pseudomonas]|uniref:hypothetical protein n=1 Tax=Pseudomonas TaxID=286 RepID=UPI00061460B9|nr:MULTISPECIES: hypothetical protein [Pseudomonas]MDT3233497.1 hypothetical protein [Pseudomonas sp. rhizo25]
MTKALEQIKIPGVEVVDGKAHVRLKRGEDLSVEVPASSLSELNSLVRLIVAGQPIKILQVTVETQNKPWQTPIPEYLLKERFKLTYDVFLYEEAPSPIVDVHIEFT